MPITIERIQQVGERIPLLANLQPHGPYAMASLHAIGGVPIVMKELLGAGLLHGDVMTVTGKTLAENLAAVPASALSGEAPPAASNGNGEAATAVKTITREAARVGRNDPCPCGSGKKYKKCHGAEVA